MTRYIDADAVEKVLTELYIKRPLDSDRWVIADIKKGIMDLPTIDAVPVKRGKWIPRYIKIAGRDFKHGMQCSVCAEPALDVEGYDYLTDYCPNCGCRMDAE